jgi:hypothetical protein
MHYDRASSASGNAQSSRRTGRSSPDTDVHIVRKDLSKSRRQQCSLRIQGQTERKRRVRPKTKGSCICTGQKGRAPAGISTTRSANLYRSLRQREVNSRGQMKMWLNQGRLCREVASSSKAWRLAAGGWRLALGPTRTTEAETGPDGACHWEIECSL